MNIEQLIPKDVTNRDEYIKNILFNKINYLGVDETIIIFKFKTDKPVYLDKINFIESDGFKLHNFGGEYEWAVVSDDVKTFDELLAMGIKIDVRKVPTDSPENFNEILKKAKTELK